MADSHLAVKKVSLSGVYEGWDDTCYAYVTPCNFETRIEALDLEKAEVSDADRFAFQTKLVEEHFVSGVCKAFDGAKFTKHTLTAEEATSLPDVSNKLAMFILGYDIDPKELSEALMKSELQTNDSPAIETPSSEASPKE